MDQGLLPRRYAKALYEFADIKPTRERLYDLMKNLQDAFVAQPQLNSVMANPYVSVADKTALLQTAAQADADADPCFFDFIKLLIKNRRIDAMRSIALAYLDIFRKANNIFPVSIKSAAALDDVQMAKLKDIISRHIGDASAEFSTEVDPSLIGGFVVTINSERLDASLSNELKQLRLNLLSN